MESKPKSEVTKQTIFLAAGPLRKILTGILSFLLICFWAVLGYVLAGWDAEDAIYMVIITIFGVGYGEVQPITTLEERALTITVIIAGYCAVIYTVGGFMQMLIDGEINKALGARRMNKEISRLDSHTIICGLGRMGTILARQMYDSDKPFIVIDSDERRIQIAKENGYLAIHGDATEEDILELVGIRRASTIATVLSKDTVNVFVTITARDLNSNIFIIARGENPNTEKKLMGCGANRVVLPTAIGANKVANLIIRPTAENMLDELTSQGNMNDDLAHIGLQFDELEVSADSTLVGRVLSDIEVRSNHGFLIVGVRRADGSTTMNPKPETKIFAGDVVVVLGHDDDIPQLAEKFAANKVKLTYRGVTMNA